MREYAFSAAAWEKLTDQIGHEYKAVFHHSNHMKRFTPEITGDLPRHLLYAFPDLVRGEKNPGVFGLNKFGFGAAHSSLSAGIFISSISTASPELLAKSRETGNPRIHTIWPALSITGHVFL
jgi:hypothetical protein